MKKQTNQQNVAEYNRRAYGLNGAISTSWDGKVKTYAISGVPGILTKFESIEDALLRLDKRGENQV